MGTGFFSFGYSTPSLHCLDRKVRYREIKMGKMGKAGKMNDKQVNQREMKDNQVKQGL